MLANYSQNPTTSFVFPLHLQHLKIFKIRIIIFHKAGLRRDGWCNPILAKLVGFHLFLTTHNSQQPGQRPFNLYRKDFLEILYNTTHSGPLVAYNADFNIHCYRYAKNMGQSLEERIPGRVQQSHKRSWSLKNSVAINL
jgi:hypothetical protein